MSAVELIKSIEARKLNPRSRLPLKEPAVTIAYAAILDNIEQDRDLARFTYLGELYQTNYRDLMDALRTADASGSVPQSGAAADPPPADPESPESGPPPAESPSPVDAPAPTPAPASQPGALDWQTINSPQLPLMRARVPGGWLVSASQSGHICFYPDPGHKWTGSND